MTLNFDYILTWFNERFAAHKKVNGSRSGGHMAMTSTEKGCLLYYVMFPYAENK